MSEDTRVADERDALDISPQDVARVVHGSSDEEIRTVVRGLGTGAVLRRIFVQMENHLVPEKARGVDSDIQFVVTDQNEEYLHAVTIRDGRCSSADGTVEGPTVTLRMDLVPFLRLVAGQATSPATSPVLYMTGKLKVIGNLMVAAGVSSFFQPPKV